MIRSSYYSLDQNKLSQVIEILPQNYWKSFLNCIHCKKTLKYDPSIKDTLRGKYLSGQGQIVIFGFTKEEIDNFEYVDIIYHEIGHKIFKEFLTREKKAKWAKVREKEFPIKLDDVYLYEELWEEEFCIVFSLVMASRFFRRYNMLSKTKKIEKGLKKINREAKVVKQLINSALTQKKRESITKETYSQKIHQRVWEWIEAQ